MVNGGVIWEAIARAIARAIASYAVSRLKP